MESRDHTKMSMVVVADIYNKTFKKIYNEFENKIFLRIRQRNPIQDPLIDFALSGCVAKPSYFFAAVCYMRIELTGEHIQDLRDSIFCQLFPVIKRSSTENVELILRCLLEAISKKILQLDVVNFEDLKNIDYRSILLQSNPFMQAMSHQDGRTVTTLQMLSFARDKDKKEYDAYVEKLVASRSKILKGEDYEEKEYYREMESEFVLSAVKLK
jgi:hypothetical protein